MTKGSEVLEQQSRKKELWTTINGPESRNSSTPPVNTNRSAYYKFYLSCGVLKYKNDISKTVFHDWEKHHRGLSPENRARHLQEVSQGHLQQSETGHFQSLFAFWLQLVFQWHPPLVWVMVSGRLARSCCLPPCRGLRVLALIACWGLLCCPSQWAQIRSQLSLLIRFTQNICYVKFQVTRISSHTVNISGLIWSF